jgi:glycosyltransferase involved in cell wall biosynthesis
MMHPQGVSLIICCHNGETRIRKALEHIAEQKQTENIPWEVVFVNNASTDRTVSITKEILSQVGIDLDYRIVEQPVLGLIHARLKGIEISKYEYMSFIDDDNWVADNWVNVVYRIMQCNEKIGACGSCNIQASEIKLPWWFTRHERSYAVGKQEEISGDVTWGKGVLFGAGLTIRKTAWKKLVNEGFKPLLVGRTGKQLTCGEDYELCLALRLNGWLLWYSSELQLFHYLPKNRLHWKYLRRMLNMVGRSSVGFDPYCRVFRNTQERGKILTILYRNNEWLCEIVQQSRILRNHKIKTIQSRFKMMEGDSDVLEIDRAIGKIVSLIKMNKKYDRTLINIKRAKWKHLNSVMENLNS